MGTGNGLTVMSYPEVEPIQPLAVGVIVMVALIGDVPVFMVVKPGTFPDPLAPRPIAVLLFVHAKVDPETGPVIGVTGAT